VYNCLAFKILLNFDLQQDYVSTPLSTDYRDGRSCVFVDLNNPSIEYFMYWFGCSCSAKDYSTCKYFEGKEKVDVRVHSECLTGDIFHSRQYDCGPQKEKIHEASTRNVQRTCKSIQGK